MISAKFLWGNVLLGGKLQIGAKNSNFEIFESALYMKSVSMPLRPNKTLKLLTYFSPWHLWFFKFLNDTWYLKSYNNQLTSTNQTLCYIHLVKGNYTTIRNAFLLTENEVLIILKQSNFCAFSVNIYIPFPCFWNNKMYFYSTSVHMLVSRKSSIGSFWFGWWMLLYLTVKHQTSCPHHDNCRSSVCCRIWRTVTDIERRIQTSYTAPCNGVFSHGAPIGGYLVLFADHTWKQMQTKCIHDLHVLCGISRMLSSHSHRSTYAPDESRLFWLRENPEYPQFEPHARIEMVQVLGSPVYICEDCTNASSLCHFYPFRNICHPNQKLW